MLGEHVLPSGGSARISVFIDVLGRLGVEEKASRQALMRRGGATDAADRMPGHCRLRLMTNRPSGRYSTPYRCSRVW